MAYKFALDEGYEGIVTVDGNGKDSVESIYDRLVENPYQFPKSRDMYLAKKGYYEAVIPQMNYIVIFDVRKDIVNIVGIFHQLENYLSKL